MFCEPIPIFTLAAMGYRNNGGCSCGCGVGCPAPYLRWSCPYDIGYACSNAFQNNPPFFGDPLRRPACTIQPAAVITTIRSFYFSLPVIFYACTALFALRFPIEDQIRHEISIGMMLRRTVGHAYDPIGKVELKVASRGKAKNLEHVMQQFAKSEIAMLTAGPGGAHMLWRASLASATSLATSAIGILCFPYFVRIDSNLAKILPAFMTLAPLACVCVAIWNTMKIHALSHDSAFVREIMFNANATSQNIGQLQIDQLPPLAVDSLLRWWQRAKNKNA